MELQERFKVFQLLGSGGGFALPTTVMRPIREGHNTFDSEHLAIQWIEEREPQERFHEFIILMTYSMG